MFKKQLIPIGAIALIALTAAPVHALDTSTLSGDTPPSEAVTMADTSTPTSTTAAAQGFGEPLVDGGSKLTITPDGATKPTTSVVLNAGVTTVNDVNTVEASTTGVSPLAYVWSGTYGVSTASGCNWVVIDNNAKTFLGNFAYRLTTRQHFCHNRAAHTVSSTAHSWSVKLNSAEQWDGWVSQSLRYFTHFSGYTHSGFLQDRQAQISNVVPIKGVWTVNHPVNKIHVYSNGTVWAAIDR